MHAHKDVARLAIAMAMTGCSLHLELGGSEDDHPNADTGTPADSDSQEAGDDATGFLDDGQADADECGISVGEDDGSGFGDDVSFIDPTFGGTDSGFDTDGCGDDGYEAGGSEDGGCQPPPPPQAVDRSLIETHPDALAALPLRDVLAAVARNGEFAVDPSGLHDQLFETYTTAAAGGTAGVPHCDDEAPANRATLDGYPIECPRPEAQLRGMLDDWITTAVVNRFDLAPVDGSSCGEQRIIFANPSLGRAFIILEARIPNPDPSCGIAACLPVVEFWASQAAVSDSIARGERLREAFLTGESSLQAAGFDPFADAANYTVGTGQLRTNNFVGETWTLREFKLVDDDGTLIARPVPVTANAFGPHFDDAVVHPRSSGCREAILEAIPDLMNDDVATMGLVLAAGCEAGESRDDDNNDFSARLSGSPGFRIAIEERIQGLDPGSELTAFDIAERARFAGSCIGCHQQSVGASLGNDVSAPFSLGFVHVGEFPGTPCADGRFCFDLSDALQSVFLPHRREVMVDVLEQFAGASCPGGAESGPGVAPALADRAKPTPGRARKTIGGRPVGSH